MCVKEPFSFLSFFGEQKQSSFRIFFSFNKMEDGFRNYGKVKVFFCSGRRLFYLSNSKRAFSVSV